MNWPATFFLLLIGLAVIAALKYSHVRQERQDKTRTDDQLKAYWVILQQSPDNRLSDADTAFVKTLFTPTLIGQYEKDYRPIERRLRRLENEFLRRALGIEIVTRWQKANPNKPMPPELRAIAEQERCLAPELKPHSPEEK